MRSADTGQTKALKAVRKEAVMFEFETNEDPGIEPDDTLEIINDIRAGDVVVFEKPGPGVVTLRALDAAEVDSYLGSKYRVSKGKNSVCIRLSTVS